jgi:hypothetical protein
LCTGAIIGGPDGPEVLAMPADARHQKD